MPGTGFRRLEEAHDINVTPFIDVTLVLLIIFMVAAPLATVDVKVDLPASAATPEPRPAKPIFLTVQADLTLRLGGCRRAGGCARRGAGPGERRRPRRNRRSRHHLSTANRRNHQSRSHCQTFRRQSPHRNRCSNRRHRPRLRQKCRCRPGLRSPNGSPLSDRLHRGRRRSRRHDQSSLHPPPHLRNPRPQRPQQPIGKAGCWRT